MVALSGELFDALEVNAARTGNHKRAAVRMSRLAVQATAGSMSRAEAHMRAGEQWMLADDPTEAVEQFQKAIADAGPTFDDPQVSLARAMFVLGRNEDADALLRELRESDALTKPRTCDLVAELLTEQGDLQAALDWATAGVEASLSSGDEVVVDVDEGRDALSGERAGSARGSYLPAAGPAFLLSSSLS